MGEGMGGVKGMKETSKRPVEQDEDIFMNAFRITTPVFLGYIPLGVAFGLLLSDAGYNWVYAFLMSLFVYAGSAQFLTVFQFKSALSFYSCSCSRNTISNACQT
jgi:4-azaleucine resistance transporter AzlC